MCTTYVSSRFARRAGVRAAANLAAMSLQMPSGGGVPGVGAGAGAVNGWKDWKTQMASPPGLLDPRAFDASRCASTPSLTLRDTTCASLTSPQAQLCSTPN